LLLSVITPSPIPGTVSTDIIFAFTYMCIHYLCHLPHCCVTITITTLKLRGLYLRNLGMRWPGCLGLSKLKLKSRVGRTSSEVQVVVADLVSGSCRGTISFLDVRS
jgi:hypothetical protein